jgi:nicotinamidase-related amidase
MAYRADLSDAGAPGGPNRVKQAPMGIGDQITAPDGTTGRILIRDTSNTDIVDELTPEAGDAVIYKHRFSGFYETEVHELLQRSNIRYLVFTGGTTSECVESTMRDAFYRDYHCLLLEDCTAEPIGQSNHNASLNLLGRVFGWVLPIRRSARHPQAARDRPQPLTTTGSLPADGADYADDSRRIKLWRDRPDLPDLDHPSRSGSHCQKPPQATKASWQVNLQIDPGNPT